MDRSSWYICNTYIFLRCAIFQNSLLQNIYRKLLLRSKDVCESCVKKTINLDLSQVDISKEVKSVAVSFVNYTNFHHSNFEKAAATFDGEAFSIWTKINWKVNSLSWSPLLATTPVIAKGAKDTMWFLPQKLDERKRVYIDQQIPSVWPLNIYLEQEARVKPLSSWVCVTLQMTLRSYWRNAIGFCDWRFI